MKQDENKTQNKTVDFTKYDYSKVKKYLKEYMVLRNIRDQSEQKKIIAPLFRLYLKATGKFIPKNK